MGCKFFLLFKQERIGKFSTLNAGIKNNDFVRLLADNSGITTQAIGTGLEMVVGNSLIFLYTH